MRRVAVLGVKLGRVARAALDIKKMAIEMKGLGVQAKASGMKMGLLAKGVWPAWRIRGPLPLHDPAPSNSPWWQFRRHQLVAAPCRGARRHRPPSISWTKRLKSSQGGLTSWRNQRDRPAEDQRRDRLAQEIFELDKKLRAG